ncbi:MAG: hypothetical protein Q9213_006259 [Squamulea squamosa]
MLKIFGYEHGMRKGDGTRPGAWTRKGPGHKSGAGAVKAPSRNVTVKRDLPDLRDDDEGQAYYDIGPKEAPPVNQPGQLPPPAYNQQVKAYYSKRQIADQQQEVRQYSRPAQHRVAPLEGALLNRRISAPHQHEQRRGVYPDDQGMRIHQEQQGRGMHLEADLRRSRSHASNRNPGMQQPQGPPQRSPDPGPSHHHYPDEYPRSARSGHNYPVERSQHGSQRFAPVQGRSFHHAPRLTVADAFLQQGGGQSPIQGRDRRSASAFYGQEDDDRQGPPPAGAQGSNRGNGYPGSRGNGGERQYTVHNDFAEAPRGSREPGYRTGPAKAGSGKEKQRAKLLMGNKTVTLADF